MQDLEKECESIEIDLLSQTEAVVAHSFASSTTMLISFGEAAKEHLDKLIQFIATWLDQMGPALINLLSQLPLELADRVNDMVMAKLPEKHSGAVTIFNQSRLNRSLASTAAA